MTCSLSIYRREGEQDKECRIEINVFLGMPYVSVCFLSLTSCLCRMADIDNLWFRMISLSSGEKYALTM